MAVHILPFEGWLEHLADLIERVVEGDTIRVDTPSKATLAENALKRVRPNVSIRVEVGDSDWWQNWGYDEEPWCGRCGERVTEEDQRFGDVCEIVNRLDPEQKHLLVHYGCRQELDDVA